MMVKIVWYRNGWVASTPFGVPFCLPVQVYNSGSVDLETKLLSHNFSQKPNGQICFSTTRKYLKLEFRFQISSTIFESSG